MGFDLRLRLFAGPRAGDRVESMADTSVTTIIKTIARRSSTMVVTWEFAVEILLLHSILGAFPRTGRDVAALGAKASKSNPPSSPARCDRPFAIN